MKKQLILSALLSAVFAGSAYASAPDDAWLAFAGCWRADGDTSGKALCIVPADDGVRMLTIVGNKIESESRVIANGLPRSLTQEGCAGTETAVWSADRQRVFLNAQLNCGNNTMRKVSGMFVMLSPTQWASIQSVSAAGGEPRMHTVRYVETTPADLPAEVVQAFLDNRLARETLRVGASSRIGLDDVKEAVKLVDTNVVEGWITTTGQEFDLNAKALIDLADSGVPSSVIDVLVAVSHPRHFAVREERRSERDWRGGRRPITCMDSYWADPYDPFFYRSSYYYGGGCGGGWGIYPWGGGYWGGGTVIVIDRGTGGQSTIPGKVTKSGYKAPRTRDNDRDSSSPSIGSSSPPKTTSTPKSGDSDSSSGGDSGGRKAKPRGT